MTEGFSLCSVSGGSPRDLWGPRLLASSSAVGGHGRRAGPPPKKGANHLNSPRARPCLDAGTREGAARKGREGVPRGKDPRQAAVTPHGS